MLLTLLKIRFLSLFSSLFSGKQKRRSAILTVLFFLLFLYVAAALIALLGGVLLLIAEPLFRAGAGYVYFAIGGLLSLLMMLLGSVILTKNQLYVAKDNELLLSMPIPPRLILISRLLLLLLVNYFFEALVAIPMVLIWLLGGRAEIGAGFCLLLLFLLLPVLALSLSSLLAYGLSRLSKRLRRKSLLTVLLSLLFLGAYYFFLFGLEDLLDALVKDVTPLVVLVDSCPPLSALGRAMAGSPLDLLFVLLPSVLFTGLVFYWLGRTYLHTVLQPPRLATPAYREKARGGRAPLLALALRELSHLGSCPAYLLNAGIGLLFLLAVPIGMLFLRDTLLGLFAELPLLGDLRGAIGASGLMALVGMVYFSASSVSLEGRALWIVRTSPVPTRTVLYAKLLFHLIPTAPTAAVAGVLTAIALRLDAPEAILLVLHALTFSLLTAALGLIANLLFPKLEWKNEAEPIKQGAASLVAMLAGFLAAALLGGVALLLSLILPASLALLISLLLSALAAWGSLVYLGRGGVRLFESL